MRSLSLFDLPFLAQAPSEFTSAIDDFESYSASDGLDGLNGGTGWAGPWVSRGGAFGVIAFDDFESYALDGLNGENGGTGWNGAWVSR